MVNTSSHRDKILGVGRVMLSAEIKLGAVGEYISCNIEILGGAKVAFCPFKDYGGFNIIVGVLCFYTLACLAHTYIVV